MDAMLCVQEDIHETNHMQIHSQPRNVGFKFFVNLTIPPSGVPTLGPQSLRECPWVGKKLKVMSLGS